MNELLFVRPCNDAAAVRIGSYGQDLRDRAIDTFDDLVATAATRAAIDAALSAARPPRSLLFFGHGQDDCLTGAGGAALIDSSNVGGISEGLVVAMACWSANTLGPQAVGHPSVRAFVGFDDPVGLIAKASAPMQDAFVEGLDCLLTSRHEIRCAADQLRQRFAAAKVEYRTNGVAMGLSAGEARTAWLYAKSNQHSVQVLGDDRATA